MRVFLSSICAAVIQVAVILAAARLLGADQYSIYSLFISASILVAAVLGEWSRMVLIRYSVARRARVRRAVLAAIRRWSDHVVIALLFLSALAIPGAIFHDSWCLFIAVCLSAAGMITADTLASYLRFNSTSRAYIEFAFVRVSLAGVLTIMTALAARRADLTIIVSGITTLIGSEYYRRLHWPAESGRIRRGLLSRCMAAGVQLSANSISTNAVMTAARAAIGTALPSAAAGAVVLSLDLAVRGLTVFGNALNTALSPNVLAHTENRNGDEVFAAARRASLIFVPAWATIGLYGALVSLAVPYLMLRVDVSEYGAIATLNILGFYLVAGRLYYLDMVSVALDRSSEVALASVLTLIIVGASLLLRLVGGAAMMPYGLLAAALLSFSVYTHRNRKQIVASVSRLDRAAFTAKFILGLMFGVLLSIEGTKLAMIGAFSALAACAIVVDGCWILWRAHAMLATIPWRR